jgi:N-acetylglucosaminyldiphosphoundecaprenol N-acetyl-beta-D-mannosaminyltransferase
VGTFTPPFRDLDSLEEAELLSTVTKCKPDFFWVGLSTPKQERFMARYLDRLDTTLMLGVGAAFDVHTGGIRDAPDWVKDAGLQWLHRLCQEPRRLWKRYFINNPKFLWKAASQFVGLKIYSNYDATDHTRFTKDRMPPRVTTRTPATPEVQLGASRTSE